MYLSWKYPNTSRKVGKFIFLCLIIGLFVQFVFFVQPSKSVRNDDLQIVQGSIEIFKIPSNKNENIAFVRLKEYPKSQFSFDMSGYSGSSKLQIGDFAIIH